MRKSPIKTLCVFCSASDRVKDKYGYILESLSNLFSALKWDIVYGGSVGGLMGGVANACLDKGLNVTGVMPSCLHSKEIAHTGLSELIFTDTMHARQLKMADLSDAFLVLPGGLGTMAELFEVVTWYQLGLHTKPSFILNIDGYWDDLVSQLDKAQKEGFMHGDMNEFLHFFNDIQSFREFFGKKD